VPDPKKLAVLEARGFKLRDVCATCTHFVNGSQRLWGHCADVPPTHAKHTDGARVSVRADGWCTRYTPDRRDIDNAAAAGFGRFLGGE
jgi:hypothetical protein